MPAATKERKPFSVAALIAAAFTADQAADHATPPCFHWAACGQRAAIEKAGRSVCRRCATALRGAEYPLRYPSPESLYASDRLAAEALDMIEERPEPDLGAAQFVGDAGSE